MSDSGSALPDKKWFRRYSRKAVDKGTYSLGMASSPKDSASLSIRFASPCRAASGLRLGVSSQNMLASKAKPLHSVQILETLALRARKDGFDASEKALRKEFKRLLKSGE